MGQSEDRGGSCRPPPHQRSQADSCTGLEYKRWAAPLLALPFRSPTELSEIWGWGEFLPLHKTQLRWLKSHIKIISTIGSPPEPSARKAGPCSFPMEKCYLCIIVANCLVGVRVQALSQESGYRGAAPTPSYSHARGPEDRRMFTMFTTIKWNEGSQWGRKFVCLKITNPGAKGAAQWLWALTALAEDWGSVASTHMVSQTTCNCSSSRPNSFSWPPWAPGTHMMHICT